MLIRFMLMNAYAVGGTIRTTFTMASELAKRHDVEVVSVYRRAKKPRAPLDPRVRLTALADDYAAEQSAGLSSPVSRAGVDCATGRRSVRARSSTRRKSAYARFNLVTDAALLRFLRTTHDARRTTTFSSGRAPASISRSPGSPGPRLSGSRRSTSTWTVIPSRSARASRRCTGGSTSSRASPKAMPRSTARCSASETRVVAVHNAVPDVGGASADLDAKVLISAWRITRQKGFDRLVPAFADVTDEHPDWQLKIFGGVHNEGHAEQLGAASSRPGRATGSPWKA